MKDVVITSAYRTAIGKLGGTLKNVQPEDLMKVVIEKLVVDSKLKDRGISEVIVGQTKQTTDSPNLARVAALAAGIPEEVPAYTIHRQCASGLQSIINGYLQIGSGFSDVILSGGVESMSTAPYYIRKGRFGYKSGNGELLDPNTESQPKSQPENIYGRFTMIDTADNVARRYEITRLEQDEFALSSQMKSISAIDSGKFSDEIVSIEIKGRKGKVTIFDTDEFPRRDTSLEKLSKLNPINKDGFVTAGNASGRNDGAAGLVLMSNERASDLNLKPLAKIVGAAAVGVDPRYMGIGPVPATKKVLKDTGLTMDDIGLIEINEAFAAQTLACVKELNIDMDKLNVNGGAIALGHPLGCSGARISVTLIHEMIRRNVRYGLATICVAGGLGVSVIFENIFTE